MDLVLRKSVAENDGTMCFTGADELTFYNKDRIFSPPGLAGVPSIHLLLRMLSFRRHYQYLELGSEALFTFGTTTKHAGTWSLPAIVP